MQETVDVATYLVERQLTGARLEERARQPRFAAVAVADLFAEMRREFGQRAEMAGLAFEVAPTRARVFSDELLLEQILRNLVSNAIKYTPLGSVSLSARRNGDYVAICVRDTGIGIPREKQRQIFEDFQRLRGNGAEGFGVGLATVSWLAAAFDHRVTVHSEAGNGASFVVQAPAA